MLKKFLTAVVLFAIFISFSYGYEFIGRKYVYVTDTFFCFNTDSFEMTTIDDNGTSVTKSYACTLCKEGPYVVANVQKENKMDKLYIFCADRNHLIFYDTDEKTVYDTTEKAGHRDEAWIYSAIDYKASSYLSEVVNGSRKDYVPENLAVEKLTEAWVEGVPGDGRNESVSFVNRPLNGSRRIYVINGFFSPDDPSLFYKNNRIKLLKINCYKNGVLTDCVEKALEDTGEMQVLEFSDRYTSFDFIIEDVYKGSTYDDTALTGIFIDALDVYDE